MQFSFIKFAFRYAFRNLWRNPRRTSLTIIVVGLSVTVSFIAQQFTTSILQLWEDETCDHGTGHAQIHAQDYWLNPDTIDFSKTINEPDAIMSILNNSQDVAASTPRLKIEGMISGPDKSVYFIGLGVEPTSELLVTPKTFSNQGDKGTFVLADDKTSIAVGAGLAASLNLSLGDEVTLISQTAQGSVNGVDAVVTGIVDVPMPSISKRLLYMHIKHAQKLIRVGDRFTEIAVRLKDSHLLPTWAPKVAPQVAQHNAELQAWWDIQPVIRDVELI
jgi:putative ABC transport system permease protein